MWKLTGGPENKPVPIQDIATFGRMRRFQPYEAVVEALKGLSDFFIVEGEAGQETIKRKNPYDPNQPAAVREARSIYAKGFGEEEPTTQFDIEAFFAAYGSTNAVRLRRTDDKLFKGSCFVEFADEETAKKFLALDPKPLWKGEHVLEIKSKKEYVDEKAQLIREGKMEPNAPHKKPFRGGRQQGGNFRGGNRDRNDRDSNDWKKRRENDQKNGFRDNRGGRGGRGRGRGGNDRGPRPDRREE
jgi:lupus La protein